MSTNHTEFVAIHAPFHTTVVVSRADYEAACDRARANRGKPWSRAIGKDHQLMATWESVIGGEGGGEGTTREEAIAHLNDPARIARQAAIDGERAREEWEAEYDLECESR